MSFVYRPTVLLCDGSNIWEISTLSKEEMQKAVEGVLNESEWGKQKWHRLTPDGCKTCRLCRTAPKGLGCLRCGQETGHADTKGFCNECDLRHHREWCESPQVRCFNAYREEMRGNYLARLNSSFARKNGLGCSI